jgi:hypothetical protein
MTPSYSGVNISITIAFTGGDVLGNPVVNMEIIETPVRTSLTNQALS